MKTAIWFSRHLPTTEQLEDAQRMGYNIVAIPEGLSLGSISIQNEKDVQNILEALWLLKLKHNAKAIFGVFPVPVRRKSFLELRIPCFEAWNIQRSVEGQKPTFIHKEWVRTM